MFVYTGTSPEGSDIVGFTPVGLLNDLVLTELNLTPGITYFASIKGQYEKCIVAHAISLCGCTLPTNINWTHAVSPCGCTNINWIHAVSPCGYTLPTVLSLIMPRAEAYGSLFVCHSVFYISFAAHAER